MKHSLFIVAVILLAGCKKDTTTSPGNSGSITHTPNLITLSYQPGVPVDLLTFHIYDLNHDDNKDKKYFRVKFITGDSVAITMEPKPIDSLASGWPQEVKQVRWGSGAEWIVNDQFFIRYSGGSFGKINYTPAPNAQHLWLIQWRETTGIGSLPNGEASFSNTAELRLFYFSTGQVSFKNGGKYSLADIGSVAGLGAPFNIYPWTDVTGMIFIPGSSPIFYFFDFKNWKYWAVRWEFIQQFNDYNWKAYPVKSLDSFVKWPQGWCKK